MFFVMLSASLAVMAASDDICQSKSRGWSVYNEEYIPECPKMFWQPRGYRYVAISSDGHIVVGEKAIGAKVSLSRVLEGPGSFSWSPNGRYFYLNDSEGSGMFSDFSLYDDDGRQVDKDFRGLLSRKMRAEFRSDGGDKLNIWGIGWQNDRAIVLAQGCCQPNRVVARLSGWTRCDEAGRSAPCAPCPSNVIGSRRRSSAMRCGSISVSP